MPFELRPLPYPYYGLEPHMSADTLGQHHDKHHRKYVDRLNDLVTGTNFANQPLDDIIRGSATDPDLKTTFNNAAQSWNHDFFWNCMAPVGTVSKSDVVNKRLTETFGSVDRFKEAFKAMAVGQFGSGWAWLVFDHGELAVTKTANAGNPMTEGVVPLLTCDVWEHAYYLDYQSRRLDFVTTFLDRLVNWPFVERRLDECRD
ncbi:MAG: superoxide dismutase [Alphaproteobacteria bacterium]|nr:superoxide dismutase [Alphaproteobacteria bacterium]